MLAIQYASYNTGYMLIFSDHGVAEEESHDSSGQSSGVVTNSHGWTLDNNDSDRGLGVSGCVGSKYILSLHTAFHFYLSQQTLPQLTGGYCFIHKTTLSVHMTDKKYF